MAMTINGKEKKKVNIFPICSLCLMVLFDVLAIVFVIMLKDYFSLSLKTFIFAILCLVLIIAIVDLIGIVGFIYKDFKLNLINISAATLFSIFLLITNIYLFSINSTVNNIIDNKGTDQYETIGVTLASYKDEYKDIKDCTSKKIGVLAEAEVGITSVFKEEASAKGLNLNYTEYNTTNDLFFALITDEIDIGVFPSNYRMLYEKDDEVDYSHYLNDVHDFYSFEKKVKTGENELANADLTLEPFNVLLIGFAPEEGSNGKYGLSDAIIVATINPKTLEVGLTSIARDSYVPISCYSGHKDKINAARGKSRQCLMDTVGNLLDLDINLYVEANFNAVVQMVDAVGGIDINSPVAFTGQTSSEVRGTYTIQIPKGYYHANGEEALAYARERHAMPGGDFDRQEHQKEVIARVLEKILQTKDINTVTNIIKTCGNNLSTNLSIQQITKLFSYLLSIDNNTSFPLFDIIDMQNARVTGYSSWYYNYSAHLPLWIYKLYDGSVKEAKDHIKDIMNGYDAKCEQKPNTKFFTYYPYERPEFYSLYFSEGQDHEDMPAYYKTLVGMSYSDALAYCNSVGAKVNIVPILPGQSGYNASQFGLVINQDVPYGSLVADYPTITLTVMGDVGGNNDFAPIDNFVGKGYMYAVEWANKYKVTYTVTWVTNNDASLNGTVKSQSVPAGTMSTQISNLVLEVYSFAPLTDAQINDLQTKVGVEQINAWGVANACTVTIQEEVTETESLNGTVKSVTPVNNPNQGNSVTVVIYKYNAAPPAPTCPSDATGEYPSCTCNDSTKEYHSGTNTCELKQTDPVDPEPVEPDPQEPVEPDPQGPVTPDPPIEG